MAGGRSDEPIGDMVGDQGAAAADARPELDHIAAEQLVLDHEIGGHAGKAAHRPIGHSALPKTRIARKDLFPLDPARGDVRPDR